MNSTSVEGVSVKASTRKHIRLDFWRKNTGNVHQRRRSRGEDVVSAVKIEAPLPVEGQGIGQTGAKTLFWPKELLPQDVPQSRIYTWGYDVDIKHIFSSAGHATTFQHAQSLLLDLGKKDISAEDVSLYLQPVTSRALY
jgi:hypothetical protein